MPLHFLPAVHSRDDLLASRLDGLLQHRPRVWVIAYDKNSRHWPKRVKTEVETPTRGYAL
jgi:hypothetical protein